MFAADEYASARRSRLCGKPSQLKEISLLVWKPILLSLLTVLGVVLLGCLLDSGFLYYQATRGVKLPFKVKLLPVMGGDLG